MRQANQRRQGSASSPCACFPLLQASSCLLKVPLYQLFLLAGETSASFFGSTHFTAFSQKFPIGAFKLSAARCFILHGWHRMHMPTLLRRALVSATLLSRLSAGRVRENKTNRTGSLYGCIFVFPNKNGKMSRALSIMGLSLALVRSTEKGHGSKGV